MALFLATVRQMVVCEDVRSVSGKPQSLSLINLLGRIRSSSTPPFPYHAPPFCVYAQLASCRGVCDLHIEIEEADSQTIILRTPRLRHYFGNDPLRVFGKVFRFRSCVFPSGGLYSVQLCYNGIGIAYEPLIVEG